MWRPSPPLRVAPIQRLPEPSARFSVRSPDPPRRVSFRQVQARADPAAWQAPSTLHRLAFGGKAVGGSVEKSRQVKQDKAAKPSTVS
jgi:hypothetical protein